MPKLGVQGARSFSQALTNTAESDTFVTGISQRRNTLMVLINADKHVIRDPLCVPDTKARASTKECHFQIVSVCRLPDPQWTLDLNEPFLKRRDRLPEPAQAPKSISAWELIKEFVGKDLARVRTLAPYLGFILRKTP